MVSVIFAPIALWERHWSYAIEIAHQEHKLGNTTLIIHCESALRSCAANPHNQSSKCKQCIHQVNYSAKKHFPDSTSHIYVSESDVELTRRSLCIPDLKNMDSLVGYTYESFHFGLDVISQLISIKRDRNIWDNNFLNLANELLANSITVYEIIKARLPKDISKVYLWGGRRSSEAPIKHFASLKNLDLIFFEEASTFNRFTLSEQEPSTFSFAFDSIQKWARQRADSVGLPYMASEAEKYFSDRKSGKSPEPSFIWFLSDSKKLDLNVSKKPILAIFTSSDWEFAALEFRPDEDFSSEFGNQYLVLARILQDHHFLDKFQLVVRWHPNHVTSGELEKNQVASIVSLNKHVHHILPSDNQNSYDLIEVADTVLVFGSTIGIESAYMGKPTILIGKATYSGLGSVYEPKTYLHLQELIGSSLKVLPNFGAVLWGDWSKNRGKLLETIDVRGNTFYLNGNRILSIKLSIRIKAALKKFYKNLVGQ
jgi:hypothetical protein